jgi:hypothetical protein
MQYPKAVIPKKGTQAPERVADMLKKKLAKRLVELNAVVTAEDRAAYLALKGITKGNLSLYMNGTIFDLKKAANMIKFFTKRIDARHKELEEVLNG